MYICAITQVYISLCLSFHLSIYSVHGSLHILWIACVYEVLKVSLKN